MPSGLSRAQIADRLQEAAELLESQHANRFRVRAYRLAADTVRNLAEDPGAILELEGLDGLVRLPNIGERLAHAIDEMSHSGRWIQLERMRGEAEPELLFQTIPNIGPELAHRIHETLHVDTLEALEVAAHDGRIEDIPGIGPRKAASIRASLDAMLAHRRRQSPRDYLEPSVRELLDVDETYRRRAKEGTLRKIAPRRFNPESEAWLPILHIDRGDWNFTVLFSNTALAHQLGRTDDWVVIYFAHAGGREHLRTVVTETRGPLEGWRVVRGREAECRRHYLSNGTS